VSHILKETHGFFHKVPTGHLVEYILKELSMYLLVTCWLNCLRNHNVITMETWGKWGSAPSVRSSPTHSVVRDLSLGKEAYRKHALWSVESEWVYSRRDPHSIPLDRRLEARHRIRHWESRVRVALTEPTFTDILNFIFSPTPSLSFTQVSFLTITHH